MQMKKTRAEYKYLNDKGRDTRKLLWYLQTGGRDGEVIDRLSKDGINLINEHYDCSDFRTTIFIRILYQYGNVIPETTYENIKNCLTAFTYDDENADAMVTWTENHRLNFANTEYLLAKLPNVHFADGVPASEHFEHAKAEILAFLDKFEKYGLAEWASINYYPLTLNPVANLIEFSGDAEMAERLKIVLDFMAYEIVSQTIPGTTITNTAQSRAYADNKMCSELGNRLEAQTRALLGEKIDTENGVCCFTAMLDNGCYKLPEVFKEVYFDKEKYEKHSSGVYLKDYPGLGLKKGTDENCRYHLTGGANTNPMVIRENMRYMRRHHLIPNRFMPSFNKLMCPLLDPFLPLIKMIWKDYSDGSANEKGNIATYTTESYSLSCLTHYKVGQPSVQQSTNSVALARNINIFTTSPAWDRSHTGSPNYWLGNRLNPDNYLAQNVMMQTYADKKAFSTHIFFPQEFFDEVDESYLDKGFIFARVGENCIMIASNAPLSFADCTGDAALVDSNKIPADYLKQSYDIVSDARKFHGYVFRVENGYESFADFVKDRLKESVVFDGKKVTYTAEHVYELCHNKGFGIDGKQQPSEFARLESKNVTINGSVYTFELNGKQLKVDLSKHTREER